MNNEANTAAAPRRSSPGVRQVPAGTTPDVALFRELFLFVSTAHENSHLGKNPLAPLGLERAIFHVTLRGEATRRECFAALRRLVKAGRLVRLDRKTVALTVAP